MVEFIDMIHENENSRFGRQRPSPLVLAASQMAEETAAVEASDNGMQQHTADDPYETYPLSVDDIRSKLFGLGISKSKDSIQRYCREGTLDCVKLGMLRRYYATEASVEVLLETLRNDAAAEGSTQLHDAESSGGQRGMNLHEDASPEDTAEDKPLHAPAQTLEEVHADAGTFMQQPEIEAIAPESEEPRRKAPPTPADNGIVDFLKEELRVKNEQIKVKDEQIAAMLERDRETNILIRGLQDRIGDAFGLLVSGKRADSNHPTGSFQGSPEDRHVTDVENRTRQDRFE